MRCSLLTLSTYLDRELAPERSAEVDAHLIGCTRCQTGLGYLREETQRVRTLARVTVPDDSTHALLSSVGLIGEDEPLPGERQWHVPAAPVEREVPPWLADERGGRTLPWSPRTPAQPPAPPPPVQQIAPPPPPPAPVAAPEVPVIDDPYTLTMSFDRPQGSTAVDDDVEPSLPVEAWPETTAPPETHADELEVEVNGSAQSPVVDTGIDEQLDDDDFILHDDEPPALVAADAAPLEAERPASIPAAVQPDEVPIVAEPQFQGPLAPAPRNPLATAVARMRDAIAVRMALLRGEEALDPEIQIVSGTGAPARHRYPAGPTNEAVPILVEPIPDDVAIPDGWLAEPEPEHVSAPEPEREFEPEPEPIAAETTFAAPAAEPVSAPGRHMRSLRSGGAHAPSWLSLEPFRQALRGISTSRAPAVGVAGRDSRLWIFGGAVLVLLLIGVLTGKQVTTLSNTPATAPNTHPTAAATLPAGQASPSALPTTAPTLAPTPPPAALLPALTGAHTLGSGATQYGVQGVRYGVHPGDYRIVFDLGDSTGAGGSPTVTVGIGPGGKTLYVEFSSVTPSGQPPAPAPGLVTGATLVVPAPSGKTVYRFTLSGSATVSGYYLSNPTRLVIDLT